MLKPLLLFALLVAPLGAQEPAEQHGIPGSLPGTERWLVNFKTRSFNLTEFRTAVYGRASVDAVAAIVAGLEKKVEKDQAPFSQFIQSMGGQVIEKFWIVNACTVEIPFTKLDEIREHGRVLFIEPDLVYSVCSPMPIKDATNSANHRVDGLQSQNILGKGVAVAIMDTGLDSNMGGSGRPHRNYYINGDINNKTGPGLSGSRLLANIQVGTYPADDPHGHGTGCGGIAAGDMWNTSGADKGHAPLANLVGYGISAGATGSSNSTTMTKAWQQIAADAIKYNTVAANNSFTGSPSPTNTTQQALDSCILNANVLCIVAAGNNKGSTTSSQSCTNGLAVAAVSDTTKKMASFSSRGPLSGDTQRFYPDVSACGVSTVMPKRDNESANYTGSGTSMAAPQVAGAATLFRSINTKATALETKAAILCSTEDISQQNLVSPYNTRNAYGVGFLRDDNLLDMAAGAGNLFSSTITASGPKTFLLDVVKGKAYSVALTWHRHTLTSTNWSNLGLTVKFGTQTLAASDTPRNLYEKTIFIATITGKVTIEVSSTHLEKDPLTFALATYEIPPPYMPGQVTSYGTGCPGSVMEDVITAVIPSQYKTKWGETRTSVCCGYYFHRAQQVFNANTVPTKFSANGMAFRHDNASLRSVNNYWIELTVNMGHTTMTAATMSTSFASNITGVMSTLVNKQKVNMPYWTALNSSVNNWLIRIPFGKPLNYTAKTGNNLLVDMIKSNASNGNAYSYYYIDSTSSSTSGVSRVYTRDRTTTNPVGNKNSNLGAVIGFTNPGTTGVIPILKGISTPEIGQSFGLEFSKSLPTTAAAVVVGFSRTKWSTHNLPFDLGWMGATGCNLLAGINLLIPTSIGANGKGNYNLGIPNDKSLIQAFLHLQGLVLDAKANTAGLATTNGLQIRLGGQP